MRKLLATRDRRNLAASLVMNLATRLPSFIIVLILLPRLATGLGPTVYGAMFAALAIGTIAAVPLGGLGTMGMRAIGAASSQHDLAEEGDGFASLLAGAAILAVPALLAAWLATAAQGFSWPLLAVASLPVVQSFFNSTFDNARLGYNEHYVTATLGLIAQVIWYGLALGMPIFSTNVMLAASIFHAPLIAASIANGLLLLRQRGHLRSGRPRHVRRLVADGAFLGAADAALTAPLSLAVIWPQHVMPGPAAAWFATQTRLFQMCLSPLVLLLVPLGGFIRLKWLMVSTDRQRAAIRLTLGMALVVGIGFAAGLGIAGPYYAARLLRLPPPGGVVALAPLFFLFAAIATFKCYSTLAYLVLDARALAKELLLVLVVTTLLSAAAATLVAPLTAFGLFAVMSAGAIFALQVSSMHRASRTTEPAA